jgi:flagellar motor protein MotB
MKRHTQTRPPMQFSTTIPGLLAAPDHSRLTGTRPSTRRRRKRLAAIAVVPVAGISFLAFRAEASHSNTTFNEIAIQPRPGSEATVNADVSAELAQAGASGGQLVLVEIAGNATAAPALDTQLTCPPNTNILDCQQTTDAAMTTAANVARHLVGSPAPADLDLYAIFQQTAGYLSEHSVHYQAINVWINTTGNQLSPVSLTRVTLSSNIAALARHAVAAGIFPGPHGCQGYTVHMIVPPGGSPGHQQALHELFATLISGCGGNLASWTPRWITTGPEPLALPTIPGVSVSQHDGVMTYTLSKTLADFAVGSATLTPTADVALDRVAADIESRAAGRRITCTGATDGTGTAAFDLQLSRQRATAVCDYLAGQGISPHLLHTIGAGKATPAAANPSLRRVTITTGES